jgi:hypothetical protein
MSQTSSKRKSRYERVRPISPFKVTARDREIVKSVYQYRFLTSEQITAIIGGSKQGVSRRLNLLFHSGWLDRPRAQLLLPDRLYARCNHSMIYALGKVGAKHLSVELDLPVSTVNWTAKNNELKSGFFLEHTLMVAQFMIMVQLACRKAKGVEFISREDVVNRRAEPFFANDKELGFDVHLFLRKGQQKSFTISVVPDAAFGLRFMDKPRGKNESFFFVEIDRATMPVRRVNLLRSSFYKKMFGYHHAWKEDVFEKTFHFRNARVLTVTTSRERIENMIEVGRQLDTRRKGLGMFLFVPQDIMSLEDPEVLFRRIWRSGNGKKCSILD